MYKTINTNCVRIDLVICEDWPGYMQGLTWLYVRIDLVICEDWPSYMWGLTWLYVRIDLLLTCRKHLHNHITSLRGEVWAHKASLTLPLFIEVPVPSQESERSCIWVLGVLIFPLSTIFQLDFRIVVTMWSFFRIVVTMWYFFRIVVTMWYFLFSFYH
jgi:hypothetical protein